MIRSEVRSQLCELVVGDRVPGERQLLRERGGERVTAPIGERWPGLSYPFEVGSRLRFAVLAAERLRDGCAEHRREGRVERTFRAVEVIEFEQLRGSFRQRFGERPRPFRQRGRLPRRKLVPRGV